MKRSEEIKAKIDDCAARFRVRKMDRELAQGEAYALMALAENEAITNTPDVAEAFALSHRAETEKKSRADSDLDDLNIELSTLWMDYRFWRERELHDEGIAAIEPVRYEANAKLKSEIICELQAELSAKNSELERVYRERYSVAQIQRAIESVFAEHSISANLVNTIIRALWGKP